MNMMTLKSCENLPNVAIKQVIKIAGNSHLKNVRKIVQKGTVLSCNTVLSSAGFKKKIIFFSFKFSLCNKMAEAEFFVTNILVSKYKCMMNS